MIVKSDVIDAISEVKEELKHYENYKNKENLNDVYTALEEAENIINEYIERIVDLQNKFEQITDKFREVNY